MRHLRNLIIALWFVFCVSWVAGDILRGPLDEHPLLWLFILPLAYAIGWYSMVWLEPSIKQDDDDDEINKRSS